MIAWIIAALLVFFVQTMLAPTWRYLIESGNQVGTALGPRDDAPKLGVIGGRLDRAFANLTEAMPIFLGLAVLAEMHIAQLPYATTAAAIFVSARIVYVPAYVSGVPGLRSIIWMTGHAGLGWLALQLLHMT